jgi:hypothetical protein
MTTLPSPITMRETPKSEVTNALYGILRMIAGYAEWQKVQETPDDEKAEKLCIITISELSVLNMDINNADQKRISALTRKLRAYQQIRLLQKFAFEEVEW